MKLLLTRGLEDLLTRLGDESLTPDLTDLHEAEASDRVSRHLASVAAPVIDEMPEGKRREEAVHVAAAVIEALQSLTGASRRVSDVRLGALDPIRIRELLRKGELVT